MGDTFNHLISKGWRLMGLWSCGDRASDLQQIHRSCPLQPRARNSLDELETCYPFSRSNLLPIQSVYTVWAHGVKLAPFGKNSIICMASKLGGALGPPRSRSSARGAARPRP